MPDLAAAPTPTRRFRFWMVGAALYVGGLVNWLILALADVRAGRVEQVSLACWLVMPFGGGLLILVPKCFPVILLTDASVGGGRAVVLAVVWFGLAAVAASAVLWTLPS
jgi:hypothetical protein